LIHAVVGTCDEKMIEILNREQLVVHVPVSELGVEQAKTFLFQAGLFSAKRGSSEDDLDQILRCFPRTPLRLRRELLPVLLTNPIDAKRMVDDELLRKVGVAQSVFQTEQCRQVIAKTLGAPGGALRWATIQKNCIEFDGLRDFLAKATGEGKLLRPLPDETFIPQFDQTRQALRLMWPGKEWS
jgi:hypothetical protein